ncbi:MAG TPA: hypothetical protein HA224_02745 [Nanoarchaeota archaeon]|nr:hypothetical protein [Nanoarchaeota archaeon]
MPNKAVKIDLKLYKEIAKLLRNYDFKYQYPSMSSFINSAIHEKLKEAKHKGLFSIKI